MPSPSLRTKLPAALLTSFGVLLAACSPAPATHHTDAGHDGGPIGSACASNTDCLSNDCEAAFTGGACVQPCSDGASCPSGSTCAQGLDAGSVCLTSCSAQADCRVGYLCDKPSGACLPAVSTTVCHKDADCPNGQSCDTAIGQCRSPVPSNTIGGPCSQDRDCTAGTMPACLTPGDGFPHGSCTADCNNDTQCGSGNVCVSIFGSFTGQPTSNCMQSCASSSSCTNGYVCQPYGGDTFCFPPCTGTIGCLDSSQVCDPTTGICGAPAADAGMADAGTPEIDAGPGEADGGFMESDGGGPYPAPFPAPPQILNLGGTVLSSPLFVPIFFSNDDMQFVAQLEAFYAAIGDSSYWQTIGADYGVGPATAFAPIVLDQAAPSNIDDGSPTSGLEGLLATAISEGAVPPPAPGTLYCLNFPSTTTITEGQLTSCGGFNGFGGYHSDMVLQDGTYVSYAVMPHCSGNGFSDIDNMTSSASHELIEATTDALPSLSPAWSTLDEEDTFWEDASGGAEVADMCQANLQAYLQITLGGTSYVVQRVWSNSAAAAGHDPCVPDFHGEVFFNAVPDIHEMIDYPTFGGSIPVRGVHIPVGQIGIVTLDLYSDAPFAPWTIQVLDNNTIMGLSPNITFTLDKSMGQNGDRIRLTIQPMHAGQGNIDFYYVNSVTGTGQNQITNYWVGVIGEQ